MDFTFSNIIDVISTNFFGGSTTLAALAIMVAIWAICAVICINLRAPPTYSVVPMIPISIFFSAFNLLNETVMIIIVLVCSVMVASEFRKVVD